MDACGHTKEWKAFNKARYAFDNSRKEKSIEENQKKKHKLWEIKNKAEKEFRVTSRKSLIIALPIALIVAIIVVITVIITLPIVLIRIIYYIKAEKGIDRIKENTGMDRAWLAYEKAEKDPNLQKSFMKFIKKRRRITIDVQKNTKLFIKQIYI